MKKTQFNQEQSFIIKQNHTTFFGQSIYVENQRMPESQRQQLDNIHSEMTDLGYPGLADKLHVTHYKGPVMHKQEEYTAVRGPMPNSSK